MAVVAVNHSTGNTYYWDQCEECGHWYRMFWFEKEKQDDSKESDEK